MTPYRTPESSANAEMRRALVEHFRYADVRRRFLMPPPFAMFLILLAYVPLFLGFEFEIDQAERGHMVDRMPSEHFVCPNGDWQRHADGLYCEPASGAGSNWYCATVYGYGGIRLSTTCSPDAGTP